MSTHDEAHGALAHEARQTRELINAPPRDGLELEGFEFALTADEQARRAATSLAIAFEAPLSCPEDVDWQTIADAASALADLAGAQLAT